MEEDDIAVKNHLFIFKLEGDTFKLVWQSSNLDRPNYRAGLIDLNSDGENKLLVVEGSYFDPEAREITLWKWNGITTTSPLTSRSKLRPPQALTNPFAAKIHLLKLCRHTYLLLLCFSGIEYSQEAQSKP